MTEPVTLRREGEIALLVIDNPPVNALSPAVVAGLAAALDAFEADRSARGLLVHCAGRTFVAGGDISSFDAPDFSAAPFNRTLARLEALDRPVACALHGTVLGGGLEVALACHFRVAVPGTQLGLPEVKLGLLPGSLGTQRLPRLAGVHLALDLIGSGRSLKAEAALSAGIVDAVRAGPPLAVGLAFLREQLAAGRAPRRTSQLPIPGEPLPADFFAQALAEAQRRKPLHPSSRNIVLAVQAATLAFAEGEAVEAGCSRHCGPRPSRRRCATCSSPSARPPRSRACRRASRCARSNAWASWARARWAAASR
jgi:3-hydroxyacyl-CoA dehydrogenase